MDRKMARTVTLVFISDIELEIYDLGGGGFNCFMKQAVVDGMLDKALASEFRGQGSNPATRPTCEAGGLTYPVIQVYGRPSFCVGNQH